MEKFLEGRMFLQKALEKILSDKDIKRAPELKQCCEEYLELLKSEVQSNKAEIGGGGGGSNPLHEQQRNQQIAPAAATPKSPNNVPNKPQDPSGAAVSSALPESVSTEAAEFVDADYYFAPFRLACAAKSPRIVTAALDSIQKLVAHKHLKGMIADPLKPERALAEGIVDTVCGCFVGTQTDEHVQLQIIKALLTCITSSSLEMHEAVLLQAVRTVYNIYLASKSSVNQATAQAALTQMLNVLFSKMELECANSAAAASDPIKQQLSSAEPQSATNSTIPSDKEKQTMEDSVSVSSKHSETSSGIVSDQHANVSKSSQIFTSTKSGGEMEDYSENQQDTASTHCDDEKAVEEREEANNKEKEDCKSNSTLISDYSTDHTDPMVPNGAGNDPTRRESLETPDAIQNEIKGMLDEIVDSATSGGGTQEAGEMGVNTAPGEDEDSIIASSGGITSPTFIHISQKDALIVFRALCKLSMKPLAEGPTDPKSHEYRSKVLSLRLILAVLQNAGPVFRSTRLFIEVIKQYLCVALSKNGVSPIPEIFEMSLNIFLALYSNFKQHLKVQIEVFIREIFLTILESPMSSFDHKWLVIGALKMICSEPQNVVDIYLNYDCDLSSANIFERLVNDLSKIAQGLHSIQLGATPAQTKRIRVKGLNCLVDILRCMVKWSNDLYYNPHDQTNLNLGSSKEDSKPLHRGSNSNLSASTFSAAVTNSEDTENNLDVPSIAPSISAGDESPSKLGGSMSSLNSIGNSSTADNPALFENIKQQKEVLEHGLDLFNKKPKKGLQFLQNQGLLSLSPEKVAEFLHQYEEKLDPTMMGDFLGEGDDFNKAVMYAYVDQFDFTDKDFLTALREFLEGFRLPGEAQKIDRLMEKFASRYCETNPHQGIFATADTAYVLAFSIIMLTTDLHSDQIKNHMTKKDYIKMNRGINDSKDLPEEYLSGIYDKIAKNKIKMRHTREHKSQKPAVDVSNEKLRRSQYEKEMEFMARTAMSLLEAASTVNTTYTSATHYQHVKPMFKIAWTPLLAAFSVGLQDCDDSEISGLCLEGIRHAIRISCIFRMDIEKDAYVQALSRFTLLTATSGLHEMKSKNIETIKTLIYVAHTDGNYLGPSWCEVLRCISQLELAQMIGTGVKPPFLQDKRPLLNTRVTQRHDSVTSGGALEILGALDQKKLMHLQESVQETSSQSVVVAVDRVFTGSIRLDGDAIVDFVTWLCHVSMEELQQPKSPRMFSLTKLVEISYYNMARIRLQWSRIWQVLGEHFNRVGCSPNEHVAFFAVDSLRQLSMKFIEKGELSGFRFQKEFLRPFEYIMKKNRSPTIRDMVVRCIAQMVHSQAVNIKSGWKNIFAVFHQAASDPDEVIVEQSFQTTAKIITSVFKTCFPSVIDSFQDSVKCLSEFTCSATFPDTSMEAIRLIRECAHIVHLNPMVFAENWNEENSNVPESDLVWVRGWFPILFELNCIITRCKLDVRTRALTVMFELLKTYAQDFKANWWKDLLKVIFRLFDVMKMEEKKIDKIEWMTTTCNHALYALIDVYSQYSEILSDIVFEDLLNQIIWCCKQENEQLARAGINCLENFLISNGGKMTEPQWNYACQVVQKLFSDTLPHQLMTWQPARDSSVTGSNSEPAKVFGPSLICCVVQLELIHAIDGILFLPLTSRKEDESYLQAAKDVEILAPNRVDEHSDGMIFKLSSHHLMILLDSLIESHKFARSFNSNNEQRTLLWKASFRGKNKPNLIQQETSSLACALRLLFCILNNDKHEPVWDHLENRLNVLCREAFEYYITLSDGHRDSWTSLLILLLTKILQMDEDKFAIHFFRFYQHLCQMIAMDLKPELRAILRKVFLRLPDLRKTQGGLGLAGGDHSNSNHTSGAPHLNSSNS